jgi:hypothetical protein
MERAPTNNDVFAKLAIVSLQNSRPEGKGSGYSTNTRTSYLGVALFEIRRSDNAFVHVVAGSYVKCYVKSTDLLLKDDIRQKTLES